MPPIPVPDRRWRFAAGSLLVATVASVASAAATEPLTLAADRAQVWEEGGCGWVILQGKAAIRDGKTTQIEGQRIAARFGPGPDGLVTIEAVADAGASPPKRWQGRAPEGVQILTPKRERVAKPPDDPLVRALHAPRVDLGPPIPTERTDGAVQPVRVQEPPPIDDAPPPIPIDDAPPTLPPPIDAPPAIDDTFPDPALPGDDPAAEPPIVVDPDAAAPINPPPAESPLQLLPEARARPAAPLLPGSQRVIRVLPRSGGTSVYGEVLDEAPDGTKTIIYQGGVNLVSRSTKKLGTIDISADQVVVWLKPAPGKTESEAKVNAEADLEIEEDQPVEVYLEGNVIFRQDEGLVSGPADERLIKAKHAFFEFNTERFVMLDTEFDVWVPEFSAPIKIRSERLQQFRSFEPGPDGRGQVPGPKTIRAERPITTGSRFPRPGYRFNSRMMDLTQIAEEPEADPEAEADGEQGPGLFWRVDARQNAFYLGQVPVFYWPRILADASDLDPPLNAINFRSNRIFGQQVITDWDGFKLFGLKRPKGIQAWNLDLDYLSRRGFAAGSELSWAGRELIPGIASDYFGYFDVWGLHDGATDILGPGPAIITNNLPAQLRVPPIQRDDVPAFRDFRGRLLFRHMQSLLPAGDDSLEDFRAQLEIGWSSDRNFMEEYYKRIFDTGLDQATLFYLIRQRDTWAFTALTEANLYPWHTESQWLPKLDYYRLGDSPLDRFTYFGNSGVSYANTHTANEVNNPFLFALPGGGRAYLPYDPVSNTSGIFKAGRAWTSHELDAPFDVGVARIVPYAQGQLVGWSNQLGGDPEGRAWGALGARGSVTAWRLFPDVSSELLNLSGLAHKATFAADFRTAYSSLDLREIAVQDDLDENTYEYARRYYSLTNYPTSVLPDQLDPRFLALRRGLSPITGTVDVQDRIDTLRLGIFQRWQTKRGPETGRRVVDVATLNLGTTFFPDKERDNFGESFGLNTYDFRWNISDRTALTSTGWFEFWEIDGLPIGGAPTDNDGITVVTTTFHIQRPPRGTFSVGYSYIDATTIRTSAAYTSMSYWLSPKWYTTAALSYDFANELVLGSNFSFTRIGADFLTTVGLSVDPQRENYTFAFELAPRLKPSLQLGGGSALNRIDPRFAPTQ